MASTDRKNLPKMVRLPSGRMVMAPQSVQPPKPPPVSGNAPGASRVSTRAAMRAAGPDHEGTIRHLDSLPDQDAREMHLATMPKAHVQGLYDHMADEQGAHADMPHRELIKAIAERTGGEAAEEPPPSAPAPRAPAPGPAAPGAPAGGPGEAAKAAKAATQKAQASGKREDHAAAAKAHDAAAEHFKGQGRQTMAALHADAAAHHARLSGSWMQQQGGAERGVNPGVAHAGVQHAMPKGGHADAAATGHAEGSIAEGATKDANAATERANHATPDAAKQLHQDAANMHRGAAAYHESQGNHAMAGQHIAAAAAHDSASREPRNWTEGGRGNVTPVGAGTAAPARAMQQGAKGGSYYLTATGRKIYKKA